MKNEIADRIAFFLKDYPPFGYLSYPDLEALASEVTVRFLEEGELLFAEGGPGQDCCFVLRKGNIKLTQGAAELATLVDQCEPGDVFGVRSILTGNDYVMSAVCEEESLVYEVPKALFQLHLTANQQFSFFFASGYAAGQAIARAAPKGPKLGMGSTEQSITYATDLLTCDQQLSIREAAKLMKARRVGSILVVEDGLPIGIVTDTDFRNKVVAEHLPVEQPIASIMSSPVKSIGSQFSFSEVLIKMIRARTHHLVITEDGTHESPAVGMVSDHDIMLAQNNSPSALIRRLAKAEDPKQWAAMRDQAEDIVADYLEKELSIELISNFITEVNDALIERAVQYAIQQVPKAQAINFCWLSLGSEGREEQLLRTDQDNALLYEGTAEGTHEVMLSVAKHVNDLLEECGFEECPAEIMARNPSYNLSLDGWRQRFGQWIQSPDPQALLNSTIFFDFRPVYGDRSLAVQLQHALIDLIDQNDIFLNHLAANALQNPPPLSFFKKFLVEKSGKHEDQFDIKKRGMMPLSDMARVLMLQYRIVDVQNTSDRFKRLAKIDSKNRELYHSAGQAYHMMMRIRAKYGLKNKNSGRFIDIESMTKLEKQILKSAFAPIKDLQEMLETRFQLAYFR